MRPSPVPCRSARTETAPALVIFASGVVLPSAVLFRGSAWGTPVALTETGSPLSGAVTPLIAQLTSLWPGGQIVFGPAVAPAQFGGWFGGVMTMFCAVTTPSSEK